MVSDNENEESLAAKVVWAQTTSAEHTRNRQAPDHP
jgi:hypothetical protein